MLCRCSPTSPWFRKWFHLLALLIFVPGVAVDPGLTTLASTAALGGFLLVEVWGGEGMGGGEGGNGVYLCAHTYVCLLCIYVYVFICTYMCTHIHMYAHEVCVSVHVHMYTHEVCVSVHMHMHTHEVCASECHATTVWCCTHCVMCQLHPLHRQCERSITVLSSLQLTVHPILEALALGGHFSHAP